MLKHQRHFLAMEHDISSGETLYRDLEVALESLDRALMCHETLMVHGLVQGTNVGLEQDGIVAPAGWDFQRAQEKIKDYIQKTIEMVKRAFDQLVRWLSDRSAAVQRQIEHLSTKIKTLAKSRVELHATNSLESIAIERMMRHDPTQYFSTNDLREMVRVLEKMVEQTVKDDGMPGQGISMLLLRYDRHTYQWLVGKDGSGTVPQGTGASGYQAINSYLDNAPVPVEAWEQLLSNARTDVSFSLSPTEIIVRLEQMRAGLKRFSQDVIQPRKDADKLLSKLAVVDEIVTEDQQKQLRAMTRLIGRNTGNITSGYNFQVRIAQHALHVLDAAANH